jgi:hypothetical protein
VADESPSRRDLLAINAYDPESKGEIEVYISHERLLAVGRRSKGQILEAAELVPQVLQCRGPVFEGFRKEEDEDKRGVGWRCYCGIPDRSYSQDGERCPPRRKQVYLVFVNEDRVVYNWRWELADPDDPLLPQGVENRFARRLP